MERDTNIVGVQRDESGIGPPKDRNKSRNIGKRKLSRLTRGGGVRYLIDVGAQSRSTTLVPNKPEMQFIWFVYSFLGVFRA